MPWMVIWPSGADIQGGWATGQTEYFPSASSFVPPPASGQGSWYLLTTAPIVW